MLADAAGADLTDEQKKFMNERKQMATKCASSLLLPSLFPGP